MDENQFHHGLRLKKIVENNFSTSKEFAELMGWKRQMLNYWYDVSFIKPDKLAPILKALKMTHEDFVRMPNVSIRDEEIERLRAQLERCRETNEDLANRMLKMMNEAELKEKKVKANS